MAKKLKTRKVPVIKRFSGTIMMQAVAGILAERLRSVPCVLGIVASDNRITTYVNNASTPATRNFIDEQVYKLHAGCPCNFVFESSIKTCSVRQFRLFIRR